MIVLGVSHLKPGGVVHDVTASLMIDGKIISSASEDRFTGIKHHEGYPAASIKFLLQDAGLRLSDVDRVSVGYGLDEDLMDSSRKSQFFSYPKKDSHFRPTQIESKDPVFFDHEYIHASGSRRHRMAPGMSLFVLVECSRCENTIKFGIGKKFLSRIQLNKAAEERDWLFQYDEHLCPSCVFEGEPKLSPTRLDPQYVDMRSPGADLTTGFP